LYLLYIAFVQQRCRLDGQAISHRCVGTGVCRESSGAHFHGELI